MGLFPGLPGNFDIGATIGNFMAVLNRIDTKLTKLIELEQRREDRERKAGTGAADRAMGIGYASGETGIINGTAFPDGYRGTPVQVPSADTGADRRGTVPGR